VLTPGAAMVAPALLETADPEYHGLLINVRTQRESIAAGSLFHKSPSGG
jgi:hypothetical protein